MKAAAVRRVQRAWQFAFQRRGKIAPALARGHGGHERLRVGVGRAGKKLLR